LAAGGSFIKNGVGAVSITSTNNTYTGTNSASLNPNGTQINQGVLRIMGDGSLGLVPQSAYNNIQFTGTAGQRSTLEALTSLTLHVNRSILISNGTEAVFTPGGASNTFTIDGIIDDSGTGSLRRRGTGTVRLANSENAYGGVTTIESGILEVTKLADGGLPSSIGNSSAAAANLRINTTLKYIGTGDSTDRSFTLNGPFPTLDASGTGPIAFTNTASLPYSQVVATVLTLTGSNTGANTLRAGLTNDGGMPLTLVKNGPGAWVLSGNSTYTGTTTVNDGTLTIQNGSGAVGNLTATSAIAVNNGGTLVLAGDATVTDRLNNNAGLTLTNGTLRLSGVAEGTTATPGLGALTLTSNTNSVLDLTGTSLLHFAASGSQTWTGTLQIWNWTGSASGGAPEQLLFGTDDTMTSLSQTQLNLISFYGDGGMAFLGTARFAGQGMGEIVPVPEPATWGVGALALAAAFWHGRATCRRKRSGSVR